MKKILYELYQSTTDDGVVITIPKEIPWSEANEENAKAEAYGEIEITPDDGLPEPVAPESDNAVWGELDAAYQEGYQEGYTEGVNTAYDQ